MKAEAKMKKQMVFVSVLLLLLVACNGCATDFKLQGPSLSWRSGAGTEPAKAISEQPLGGHVLFMGEGSAAASSPSKD